jgi:hypothetical protein
MESGISFRPFNFCPFAFFYNILSPQRKQPAHIHSFNNENLAFLRSAKRKVVLMGTIVLCLVTLALGTCKKEKVAAPPEIVITNKPETIPV